MRRERGLWAIIIYKLAKGGLWLLFAATLIVMMHVHVPLGERLLGVAAHLRRHSGAWSVALAELVVRAATRRGLWTVTFALAADGLVSLLEGWALFQAHWWGPWLVVVATGVFLPFEVVALLRRASVLRVALLVMNLAIVIYLARRAVCELRERARTPIPARPLS
ncbi:MAG: DUF2127 domain-containing protein [Myxococcota bacterium]|nr:DUF2127 domain-containing protein [Myxococcota bacterium]